MSEFKFTTTDPAAFDATIYIMPVALQCADFSNSFYRADADRAKLLGITEYTDGTPLCEVLFENPGEDSSWYNGDMPKYLQAILAGDNKHTVRAPNYVPARWVRDLILFDGIELHPNENCVIRLKLNSYQGIKGDSSAKLVLNQNLTAEINNKRKYAGEAKEKSDKKGFAKHARHLAALLDLAGCKTEADQWRAEANKALEEKMPEYCMV